LNRLKKDELKEKILEGYNESQDLRKFVKEKVRGEGIKWSEENKSNANWTEMTKKVFKKIGKEFGYEIEDTEENKEFMALDQVWFNKENGEAVLALETENSARIQVILKDEFRKLLNFKSDYKILIWYKKRKEEEEDEIYEKLQKKVNDHPKVLKNEVFFIIRLWQDGKVIGITIRELKKGKKRKKESNLQVYDLDKPEDKVKEWKEE